MPTRAAVAAALLKQLTAGGQFTNSGRRDRAPEQAAEVGEPALYLLKPRERYRYANEDQRGIPPVRELVYWAVIYTNVGTNENAVPADVIDGLLDAVDVAMCSNLSLDGLQTLGGIVYDARIDGEVESAPGDVQGIGTTLIPIVVILNTYP